MLFLRKKLTLLYTFIIAILGIVFFIGTPVHAMKVEHYSYKQIHDALPKKFQKSDYLTKDSDGVAYIKFANIGDKPYRTSVKKTSGQSDYLYCVDYTKHIVFNRTYSAQDYLFNDGLRTRIGIALYYGTTEWGKKANSTFTTGNYVLDYYMTQLVIHCLVYDFGNEKSSYGISFKQIQFDEEASTLKSKTTALYNLCYKATIQFPNGQFQPTEFSFEKKGSIPLYLNGDTLESEEITCCNNSDNAMVSSYKRDIITSKIPSDNISVISKQDRYDSSFHIAINTQNLEELDPGDYNIAVEEEINFSPYIANFWNCKDPKFSDDSQELSGLGITTSKLKDLVSFDILIGEVTIKKTDLYTDELISDAAFDLLQYDDNQKDYIFYKHLQYNKETQLYESGNFYCNQSNSNHMFKIIESHAGKHYKNDWAGEEFQLTKDNCIFQFDVPNAPEFGMVTLQKRGEDFILKDKQFVKKDPVPIEGITFSFYAQEDIYLKDKLIYKKNQKITDAVTDTDGKLTINDLPLGKYYFKEQKCNPYHAIDVENHSFEITRDSERKYDTLEFKIDNWLKKCTIHLYKFYYDIKDSEKKQKIDLKNAKFGLYAMHDIKNISGQVIVEKDTLIQEGLTDDKGNLIFDDLIYADYYLKEIEAPSGFELYTEKIPVMKDDFEIQEDGAWNTKVECSNEMQFFNFKLIKYGEVLKNIERKSSDNGDFFTYTTENNELANAKFSLYDENEQLIASSITDKNGILYFNNLEPGKYYYCEDSVSEEYLLNQERTSLTIDPDDRNKVHKNVVPVIEKNAYNQLFTTNISIKKQGEHVKSTSSGMQYDYLPLKDIIFGIYQDFDYMTKDGATLLTGSCVGYLVTDSEGIATFQAKLPIGHYYLKELKTNPGYELDQTKYYFDVSSNANQDYNVQLKNGNLFTNYLSKAAVKIIKTDANTDKALKNVQFTLYDEHDHKIDVYKTNKKGEILVENLPYGSYYFIETKCRNGYYSSNNKYHFKLENEDTVILNITNQPILKLGFNEPFKIILIICCCLIITAFFSLPNILNRKRRHSNETK